MKTLNKYILFSTLSFLVTPIYANVELKAGHTLQKNEMMSRATSTIKIGEESYYILKTSNLNSKSQDTSNVKPQTYLANQYGVVGISDNTVTIYDVSPSHVQSVAANIIESANSSQIYDHLKIISLKFNNINEAVTAYQQLIKVLPAKNVALPIQFSQPKLK